MEFSFTMTPSLPMNVILGLPLCVYISEDPLMECGEAAGTNQWYAQTSKKKKVPLSRLLSLEFLFFSFTLLLFLGMQRS
jgi:hypothetical protein